MSTFSDAQIQAFRDLRAVWPDTRFSLIGASGLTCQMPDFHRQTNDLDVSVAMSLDRIPSDLDRLPGWKRHPGMEHSWSTDSGVRVDVIPAGPEHLAAGEIVWASGVAMSLVGFRHVFDQAKPMKLAPDVVIDVASIPTIVLLKMVSYRDRPPERDRDIADVAHVLDSYVADGDVDRRFSSPVLSAGVGFEETSAYLLGHDLRVIVDRAERHVIETFLDMVESESDGGRAQALMLRYGRNWANDPEGLFRALVAFRRGLEGG